MKTLFLPPPLPWHSLLFLVLTTQLGCQSQGSQSSPLGPETNSTPPPTVSFQNLPAVDDDNVTRYPIKGECSEEKQPLVVRVEDQSPSYRPICQEGKWSLKMDLSQLDIIKNPPQVSKEGETQSQDGITITVDQISSQGLSGRVQSKVSIARPGLTGDFNKGNPVRGTNGNSSRPISFQGTCSSKGGQVQLFNPLKVEIHSTPCQPPANLQQQNPQQQNPQDEQEEGNWEMGQWSLQLNLRIENPGTTNSRSLLYNSEQGAPEFLIGTGEEAQILLVHISEAGIASSSSTLTIIP